MPARDAIATKDWLAEGLYNLDRIATRYEAAGRSDVAKNIRAGIDLWLKQSLEELLSVTDLRPIGGGVSPEQTHGAIGDTTAPAAVMERGLHEESGVLADATGRRFVRYEQDGSLPAGHGVRYLPGMEPRHYIGVPIYRVDESTGVGVKVGETY